MKSPQPAIIAKEERVRLPERTMAGLEKARRAGHISGRPALAVHHERIARIDKEGYTTREIGEALEISAVSICRTLKGYRPSRLAEVL